LNENTLERTLEKHLDGL